MCFKNTRSYSLLNDIDYLSEPKPLIHCLSTLSSGIGHNSKSSANMIAGPAGSSKIRSRSEPHFPQNNLTSSNNRERFDRIRRISEDESPIRSVVLSKSDNEESNEVFKDAQDGTEEQDIAELIEQAEQLIVPISNDQTENLVSLTEYNVTDDEKYRQIVSNRTQSVNTAQPQPNQNLGLAFFDLKFNCN